VSRAPQVCFVFVFVSLLADYLQGRLRELRRRWLGRTEITVTRDAWKGPSRRLIVVWALGAFFFIIILIFSLLTYYLQVDYMNYDDDSEGLKWPWQGTCEKGPDDATRYIFFIILIFWLTKHGL
jgi:hypothetical protein